MSYKKYVRISIGILFILIGVTAIIISINAKLYDQVFWFCYVALILIGTGVIIKNPSLLIAELNILIVPFIVWGTDFFYLLITKKPLWGITDYFFIQGSLLPKLISLQHLFTVPLVLYILYLTKISRKDMWKFSFLQIAAIYIVTFLFTSPQKNINCVFESCMPFIGTGKFYILTWFTVILVITFITNSVIIRLPFLQKNVNSDKTKSLAPKGPPSS